MRENNEAREQEPLPMTLPQAYVVERECWKKKICSSLEYLPRFAPLTTAVGCSYTRMVLPSLYDD